MGVTINAIYLGNKKVKAVHEPSQAELITDAPKDNQGEGTSFSPSDLFATSLGACMMTIMANVADRNGINIKGSTVTVIKEMNTEPRRIKSLTVTFHLPQKLADPDRKKLENAALTCPVHRSLHPEVAVPLKFVYDLEI